MHYDPALTGRLTLAWVVVSAGLLVVLVTRVDRDRTVGERIFGVAHRDAWRPALLAAQSGLLLICLAAREFPSAQAVMPLGLGIVLLLVMPSRQERVIGTKGVSSGWIGTPYSKMEEWRLTGEHLRYRARGEWLAVEVPRKDQARVRAILEREAPGRESEYAA